MLNRAARTLSALTVIAGTSLALPSSTSAATCSSDMVTEAGTCAAPVAAYALTDHQKKALAEKKSNHAALLNLMKNSTGPGVLSPDNFPSDGGGGTTAENRQISRAASMRIFKEGEGNGKKSYTCGPSASRNVIYAMYAHDYGEATFASWEGTTTAGTSRANIASALNAHFSSAWATTRPSSATDYLTYVMSDVKFGPQGVIANIDTEELSFFNNKALNHFDFVYGYDTTSSPKYLYIGEEWDPIYIYGSSSYGNPYGRHKELLSNAYSAVVKTSIHGIVW